MLSTLLQAKRRKQEFQGNKNLNLHLSTLYIHNVYAIFKLLGISVMLNLKSYLVTNNNIYINKYLFNLKNKYKI